MTNGIHIHGELAAENVRKGVFLVVLYADRVPPHIGLMIDFRYHSLSIKGQELDVPGDVLLKNISIRKIPSVFMAIGKHPVFSADHMGECFMEIIKQFRRVGEEDATCLSPVKLFFEEFYAINRSRIDLIFDLLEALKKNDFAGPGYGANLGQLKQNNFYLHPYKREDLDQQIREELKKLKK